MFPFFNFLQTAMMGVQNPAALARTMAMANIAPQELTAQMASANAPSQFAQMMQPHMGGPGLNNLPSPLPNQTQMQPNVAQPNTPMAPAGWGQLHGQMPMSAEAAMPKMPGYGGVNAPMGPAGVMQQSDVGDTKPGKGYQAIMLKGQNAQNFGKFTDALVEGGLTNKYGLAAVAATGVHESRFAPKNIGGTWSDPSESGKQGTSGGALSWRNERLRAGMAWAEKNGLPWADAGTQGKWFLAENPDLVAQLNSVGSLEEAMGLVNGNIQFAGWNRPGGEAADRFQTASRLLGQEAMEGGKPWGTGDFNLPQDMAKSPIAQMQDAINPFSQAGAAMMGQPRAGTNATSNKAQTLMDQLAALGQSIEAPPEPEQPKPFGSHSGPNVGGYARDANSIRTMMMMLGPQAGSPIPTLAQLIGGR